MSSFRFRALHAPDTPLKRAQCTRSRPLSPSSTGRGRGAVRGLKGSAVLSALRVQGFRMSDSRSLAGLAAVAVGRAGSRTAPAPDRGEVSRVVPLRRGLGEVSARARRRSHSSPSGRSSRTRSRIADGPTGDTGRAVPHHRPARVAAHRQLICSPRIPD